MSIVKKVEKPRWLLIVIDWEMNDPNKYLLIGLETPKNIDTFSTHIERSLQILLLANAKSSRLDLLNNTVAFLRIDGDADFYRGCAIHIAQSPK